MGLIRFTTTRQTTTLVGLSVVVLSLALAHAAASSTSARPKLSVRGGTATEESRAAVFKVSLSRAAPGRVSVRYATADDSASAGTDYVAKRGNLVFKRGQRTKTVRVTVRDDSIPEGARSFFLVLSRAQGARIGVARARAVIAKSDLPTFTLRATIDGAQESANAGGRGDPTA